MASVPHLTTDPQGPAGRTTKDAPAVEETLLPTDRRTPIIPPVAVAAMGIVLTVGLPLAGTLSPGHALEVALVVVAISAMVAMAASCVVHRSRLVELNCRRAEALRLDEGAGARELALADSRRQLVSWVSDDLRIPLASLRTTAEALEDGVITDRDHVASALASMRFEADRLSVLLTDLFELTQAPISRSEGAGPMIPESSGLGDVARSATGALASPAPAERSARARDQSAFDMAFGVEAVPAEVARSASGPSS